VEPKSVNSIFSKPETADEIVPAEAYVCGDWLQLEKKRLWPKVWQMACREEEIPAPGDYYTYEIADESITVVRLEDGQLGAYFNVCPHRGRRLTSGCGRMGRFHCRFHGWQWSLEGAPLDVVDRHDWGEALPDDDIRLAKVRVESWGGWIFVNPDPQAQPLTDFLEPAKTHLDPFEFEKMRYRWRKQVVLPCNWKVAQEAFNEGYHVQTTHRQLLPLFDDVTYSQAMGRHGMFGYAPTALYGLPSPRLGAQVGDVRKGLHAFNCEIWETLQATATAEMLAAGERLMELPETATPFEVYAAFAQFHREESAKNGTPWPDVTVEQLMAAGTDWHIFPNMVFLHQPTNLLGYRSRPNGDDPDSCIFEIYVLERFPEGQAPKVEVEVAEDWRTVDWGLILAQDFDNVGEIQKGMKSQGFRGARPSPVQERAISNFHAALRRFLHEKN
jgi:phenylpropionate dioxygenase-like ring-hydroxylating dioxygenase large terminal subunit